MFKNILLPLNNSKLDQLALSYAVALAERLGAELLLLSIVANETVDASGEASHYLHQLQTELNQQKSIRTRLLLGRGEAVKEISQAIHNYKVDAVVMAITPQAALGRAVAEEALRETNLPFLLIAPQSEDAPTSDTFPAPPASFLTGPVLVPLNGTALAELALSPALALTEATQTRLALLAVIPTQEEIAMLTAQAMTAAYYPAELDPDEIEKRATAYLDNVKTRLSSHHNVTTHIAHGGAAATEITRYAQQIDAGLVVIASHLRSGVRRAIQGSVAGQVLRESGRPVLILAGDNGQLEEIS